MERLKYSREREKKNLSNKMTKVMPWLKRKAKEDKTVHKSVWKSMSMKYILLTYVRERGDN